MTKQGIYKILYNFELAPKVFRMVLEGDTSALLSPGQFVNIKIDGLYLRRPISVCDYDKSTIVLIYKVVGEGTEKMTAMVPGQKIDTLIGLGNGYNTAKSGDHPVCIGGGVGVPPMYGLAKRLIAEGKDVTVILGFNTASEVFWKEEFEALGVPVTVTTADGSMGVKGFVTDAIREAAIDFDYFYSCGPLPMLKALCGCTDKPGELSFEERMGCGFGACMGCSCKTLTGNKRICKEGPVMRREEIIW